jgi:DNA-binding transcriptional LysR family regulator
MDLRDAECFLAIVEHRNFGRAAAALGMAQPSLSRRIALLEADLGVRLFSRERRQIELTKSGDVWASEARALLVRALQARRAVTDAANEKYGSLTFGFVGSSAYRVVPSALRRFRRLRPSARVRLHEQLGARQVDALRSGTLDLALIRGPVESHGFRSETLRIDELVAVLPAAHPLARRKRIDAGDLSGEPFIMFNRYGATGMHDVVRGVCASAGFVPRIGQEVESIETFLACVAGELGVGLIYDVSAEVPIAGVVYRPLRSGAPAIELAAVMRADCINPHVPVFVEALRSSVS